MKKVLKHLEAHFEEDIMTVLLGIIAIVMMLQVIMRYVFGDALNWAEELSRYLYIWFVFLSAGYCARKNTDLRVEIVVDLFPRLIRAAILVLGQIAITAFYAFMAYHSVAVVGNLHSTMRLSAAMQIPMWWIYAATLVGFVLGVIRSIQRICLVIIETRQNPVTKAEE